MGICSHESRNVSARDGCTQSASFETWTMPWGKMKCGPAQKKRILTVKRIGRAHRNERTVWLESKYTGAGAKKEVIYNITMELNVNVQAPDPVVLHDRWRAEESRVEAAQTGVQEKIYRSCSSLMYVLHAGRITQLFS